MQLASYPEILINREILHHIPTATTSSEDYRKILITPTNEILPKRLIRTFLEDGFWEMLNEAEKVADQNRTVGYLAHYLKRFISATARFNHLLWPYATERGANTITKYIQTR